MTSYAVRIVAAVCLVALAASACSSGPPRRGGGPGGPGGGPGGFRGQVSDVRIARPVALLFVGMDLDHDLVVTADELAQGIKTEWARADRDKSGVLSGFEMADWDLAVLGDKDATPDRLSLDSNVDGSVSPKEFEDGLKREFRLLDKNGDGRLERSELLVANEFRRPDGPDGEGGGARGGPPGGRGNRGNRGGGGPY